MCIAASMSAMSCILCDIRASRRFVAPMFPVSTATRAGPENMKLETQQEGKGCLTAFGPRPVFGEHKAVAVLHAKLPMRGSPPPRRIVASPRGLG